MVIRLFINLLILQIMRVTLAHFQLVGNIPVLRDKLKSLQRGDFKIWVASFNNLRLTASGPEDLYVYNKIVDEL
jgi:hypothetical protein